MKSLNFLRIMVSVVIILLTLFSVTPAYADAPVRNVNTIDFTITFPGSQNGCGFDVTIHEYGQTKTTIWYDAAGNPTKSIETLAGPLNFTWDAGNGKTLNGLVQGPIQITYLSLTERIVSNKGTSLLTIVPGFGPALYSTGNYSVRQVQVSGEWVDVEVIKRVGLDALTPESLAAACAYIGP